MLPDKGVTQQSSDSIRAEPSSLPCRAALESDLVIGKTGEDSQLPLQAGLNLKISKFP